MHFREIENPNDLGQVELLPIVLRRPAEQAEKIADSFRQITVLYISDEARALVALAHLRSVQIQDERDVSETRRRDAEGPINLNVFRRVGQMVLAPDHVGDFHLDVVHDVDEMENPRAIRPPNRHVGIRPGIGQIEFDVAANRIVDDDLLALEPKTD